MKRLIAVLLLALLALPAPAHAAAAPKIRVLTHNVMMLSPLLVGDYGNATRATLIPNADYVKGYDVVVIQEAFDNGPSQTLKNGLAVEYPHQTPVMGRSKSGWDQTLGAFSWLTPEDGGAFIASKWPILKKVQYVYSDACGADWFSNKGFVYVVLDVNGQKVHVVGTHMQAEDSTCSSAAAVRASQFAEIDAFLDSRRIPSGEQVVMAGDLNVIRTSPEYSTMLGLLDAAAPTSYAGHEFSWDPVLNAFNAERYPGYAPEHLDYVLYRNGNARPSSWTNTVLTPQSPPYTAGGNTYTEYSDHYPVAGG